MSDLSSWCLRYYDVLRDFAGPVATVLAATGVAGFVTWKLGTRQVEIAAQQAATAKLQATTAKQQADTALDRLRYDLFEKRYAIYVTAKELMRLLVNEGQAERLDEIAVTEKLVVIEECVFFFPESACAFFAQLRNDTYRILEFRAKRSAHDAEAARQLGEELGKLATSFRQMPQLFEATLGFPQLTRSPIE